MNDNGLSECCPHCKKKVYWYSPNDRLTQVYCYTCKDYINPVNLDSGWDYHVTDGTNFLTDLFTTDIEGHECLGTTIAYFGDIAMLELPPNYVLI